MCVCVCVSHVISINYSSPFDFLVNGVSRLVKVRQVLLHIGICRLKTWVGARRYLLLDWLLLLLGETSTVLSSSSMLLLCSGSAPAKLLLLLMLDHDFEPLLEIFLHSHSAPLQQVLNPLNLVLQILELRILALILLLVLVDALLELIFFRSLYKLSIVINHASECILLANLFDLISEIFNSCSSLVNICAKMLASCILIFEQGSVLFHCFVLPIAFSEHVKCFGPVSQVF